jgi:hypothetical protein
LPPEGTLPLWLTNDGLQAADAGLTFTELAEILTDLTSWADAAKTRSRCQTRSGSCMASATKMPTHPPAKPPAAYVCVLLQVPFGLGRSGKVADHGL